MLKLETERLKVKVIKREDCLAVFAFYVLIDYRAFETWLRSR